MKWGYKSLVLLVFLLVAAVWGCAPMQPREAEPQDAPASTESAVPAEEEAEPTPVLDVRLERRLTEDLLRAVERYYALLQEKDVEQASMYVAAPQRAEFQDDLWDLVARYKIQSADVASYQLFPQPDDTVTASVKVVRTMFPRHSVVPEKSERWMSWEYRNNRWTLRPQEDK